MPGRRTPPMPARLGAAMGDQRVDEGAVGIARGRMDDQAGGLVDDDQMCILETDIERHRLRRRCRHPRAAGNERRRNSGPAEPAAPGRAQRRRRCDT